MVSDVIEKSLDPRFLLCATNSSMRKAALRHWADLMAHGHDGCIKRKYKISNLLFSQYQKHC